MKMKKTLAVILLMSTLLLSTNVSNAVIMGVQVQTKTGGGTSGRITICTEVYRNQVYVYSGVYRYDFGVNSFIRESQELLTRFNVSGYYYTSNTTTPYSISMTANRVNNQRSAAIAEAYEYIACTAKTTSTAFGNSTQIVNREIK